MPTEATRNKLDALAIVSGVTVSIVLAVVGYEYNSLVGQLDDVHAEAKQLRDDLASLRILVAENTVHRVTHESEANLWKRRIERNEGQIQEIRTTPNARKDPFTGAEGAKHWDEIQENRERIHALELCCRGLK